MICGGKTLEPIIDIPAGSRPGDTLPYAYHSMPAGTRCHVVEVRNGGTQEVHVRVTVSPQGGVEIPAGGGTSTIAMTNYATYNPGSLVVTKTITGPAAGQQGQVVIGVTCGDRALRDFVIPARTGSPFVSQTYPDIPEGTICTVVEKVDGHTSTVAVAITGGGEATVPAGGTAHLTLTDTYSSDPGTLVVNKTITGPAAGHQGAVTIQVTCNGTPLPSFTIASGVAAGTRTRTYGGLTPSATCTVAETQDGHTNAVHVAVAGDRQATISSAGAVTASLVDTYTGATGNLRVEKTIGGPGAGSQGTIRMGVTCDGRALPAFVIPARAWAGTRSHTYANLPAFAACTVYEIVNGHTTRIVVTVTGLGQRATIPANGTAAIKISNRYNTHSGLGRGASRAATASPSGTATVHRVAARSYRARGAADLADLGLPRQDGPTVAAADAVVSRLRGAFTPLSGVITRSG